jgi:hypothetical protein
MLREVGLGQAEESEEVMGLVWPRLRLELYQDDVCQPPPQQPQDTRLPTRTAMPLELDEQVDALGVTEQLQLGEDPRAGRPEIRE